MLQSMGLQRVGCDSVTEQEIYFEKKLWQRRNNTSLDCLLILQVKKSLFWLISHGATNLKNYTTSWAGNTVHNHRLLYNLIYREHFITEKITTFLYTKFKNVEKLIFTFFIQYTMIFFLCFNRMLNKSKKPKV